MGFVDARRPDYQYALDRLEREQVEENWKKEKTFNVMSHDKMFMNLVPGMLNMQS